MLRPSRSRDDFRNPVAAWAVRTVVLLILLTLVGQPARAQEGIRELVVRETQQSQPTTPAEILTAVENLLQVGAETEAVEYLTRLNTALSDSAALVALHQQFGSAVFLRLARDRRVAPLGGELASRVLEAAHAAARDPSRIAALVSQVASNDAVERTNGLVAMAEVGPDAVEPLLQALATRAEQADVARRWQAALAAVGPPAVPPLSAALRSGDPVLQYYAAVALGQSGDASAVPHLLFPALAAGVDEQVSRAATAALKHLLVNEPSPASGALLLADRVTMLLSTNRSRPTETATSHTLWQWNAQQKTLQQKTVPGQLGAAVEAQQLAQDLVRLFPGNQLHQQLARVAALAVAKLESGLSQPLPAKAPEERGHTASKVAVATPRELLEALRLALELDNVPASIAAAEVLGDVGTEQLLRAPHGTRSVLASAVRYPDRRVQFAAADAIVRVDPREAYLGAADVARLAVFLASTHGTRRVLVVHPLAGRRAALAAAFGEIGFEVDAVPRARDGMRRLLAHPDFEMVVLSDRLTRVRWTEFLQQLEGDWRTSEIPKVVLSSPGRLDRNGYLSAEVPRVVVFPEPQDAAAVLSLVQQALPLAGSSPITAGERLAQAETALDWLVHMSAHPDRYAFYDIGDRQTALESALHTPPLAARAATVLGNLGTPAAQLALVSFASETYQPEPLRELAVAALETAIRRTGVQLTGTRIQQQYALYNDNAGTAAASPQILGELLDLIEQPTRKP